MAYNDNVGAPPPAPVSTGYDNNSGYDDGAYSSYSPPQPQAVPPPQPAATTNQGNMVSLEVEDGNTQNTTQNPEQGPNAVSMCLGYFPVKYVNVISGLIFMGVPIADFVLDFDFLDLFINCFLICFGIIMVCIEWQRAGWNSSIQAKVFKWAKFLERLWGKSFTYFLLSVICMSDTKSIFKIIGGIFVFLTSLYNLFVGVLVCRHMKRITIYALGGCDPERFEEDCVPYLTKKFQELDQHKLERLTIIEMKLLAAQAGRDLTPTEADTIVRFFDEHLSYEITLENFINGFKQFSTQRFWSL